MGDELAQEFSIAPSNEHIKIHEKQSESQRSSSISTEIIDSGIASLITPLSLINDKQFLSFQLLAAGKPILGYKKCKEYMEYSNCLITYLDHPSAIFIQIPDDGPAFQQMHQDMNRYYMNNQSTIFFEIGDFCIAYSIRYSEFYRGRIIKINRIHNLYLVVFVDFGNSEWINIKNIYPLEAKYSKLKIQSTAVTLSHIVPKRDLKTGLATWDTNTSKRCIRKLRRLLIKPNDEPFLFVSVTFLPNEDWWPLSFVDIKLDGQDLAEILQNDGLARLTRDNKDLKTIYPDFGTHLEEYFIFGVQQSKSYLRS